MPIRPTLINYLIVLFKWKKLIAGMILLFVVIAAIFVLLMPPVYLAETRILPPETDNSTTTAQLLSQLGGISLTGGLIGKKSVSDLYVGLLQSRTILDRVVERFGLIDVYKVKYREEARNRLLTVLRINIDRKSGLISISVEDRDPQRVTALASSFVEELTRITQEVAITEASQRRLFYENKLKEAKESLIRTEEAMKGFQEKTGTIEMKEQAKAVIESVAKLRAQIASKEVSLKVLRTYTMPKNPDLQKTEDELRGMKEQLVKMESKSGKNSDGLVSTGSFLEAGTGYVRKMRDLKYNESVFELLSKQYEMAKMDESRNSASIQVIDKAITPEKRARPKRTKTIAIAALIGAFAGILATFIMENCERLLADPSYRDQLEKLRQYVKGGPQQS